MTVPVKIFPENRHAESGIVVNLLSSVRDFSTGDQLSFILNVTS
jgi:hypothetical protein